MDWDRIKLDAIAGAKLPKLAERYGIDEATIREKADIEGWPIALEPIPVEESANSLSLSKSDLTPDSKVAEDYQVLVAETALKALKRFAATAPTPRNWTDFGRIVDQIDRVLGIQRVSEPQNAVLVNINTLSDRGAIVAVSEPQSATKRELED